MKAQKEEKRLISSHWGLPPHVTGITDGDHFIKDELITTEHRR